MPKIDTTKIEGYDAMSAEDKIKALLGYEIDAPAPAVNDSADKLRRALEKANSEAAEWKRQLREKQSEAERAEAERAEKDKAVMDELEALRKERTISKLEAKYLAAGYTPELAAASAKAAADGDTDTVLANQMAFIEVTKKNLEAAALGKQPPLSVGEPPKATPPLTEEDKIIAEALKYAGLS